MTVIDIDATNIGESVCTCENLNDDIITLRFRNQTSIKMTKNNAVEVLREMRYIAMSYYAMGVNDMSASMKKEASN